MRFSVIIPTRNRPRSLDRCLTALEALDFPREDFEVVVVDDGSAIRPDEIIARHSARLQLRYDRYDGSGPARARNRGLRQAQGEYVVFTDDDCEPSPDWLRALDQAFVQSPQAALGGRIVSSPGEGICGRTSQMLVTFLYSCAREGAGTLQFFCSNNLAFPRVALLELGGFDEAFPLAAAEDRELCARWAQRSELRYVANASVLHRQGLTLKSFCMQQYRYGRGAFQYWLGRRTVREHAARVKPLRFYSRLLAFPFSSEPAAKAMVMILLLSLSQVLHAAGYFLEAWSKRNRVPLVAQQVSEAGESLGHSGLEA